MAEISEIKAGLHRTHIGSIELGKQNVSLENIGRLAKHLKVTLPELLNRSTTRSRLSRALSDNFIVF